MTATPNPVCAGNRRTSLSACDGSAHASPTCAMLPSKATSRPVPAGNPADGAGRAFPFITDTPALRRARLDAAKARLAWETARKGKAASERLHRVYVLAKAAVIAAEVRS